MFEHWFRRLLRIAPEDWVFASFASRSRLRAWMRRPYLAVPDALAFVDACEAEDLAVLGMDGFDFDPADRSITPRMELILDCSYVGAAEWSAFRSRANDAARAMLRGVQAEPNVVFEFILWSEAERASTAAGGATIEIAPGRTLRMSPKMLKLMPQRGWSTERLADLVSRPHRTVATVDRTRRPR